MWQRKQTLFLVCTLVIMVIMTVFPFVSFYEESTTDILDMSFFSLKKGEEMISFAWPSAVMSVICMLLTLVSVVLYKNRVLQMRIAYFSALLYIGCIILVMVETFMIQPEGYEKTFSTIVLLPIFAIILLVMAARSIATDEKLVRSADRLR